MYNYTFIIPHHNSPNLLNRCIDSIPERDDIQIIVVDDNSDEDKNPKVIRKDVEIVRIDSEHTKGAGRARNYGMKRAKGKWLLFADCDDFYTEGFLQVLDRYKDCDLDVLYFNADSVDSKTLKKTPIGTRKLNEMVENSLGDEDAFFKLRCFYNAAWAKMTSRTFIEEQEISFEETINGNDIMFSHYVGYLAKKRKVIPDKLYVYTTSNKGLTSQKTRIDAWMSRIDHNYKQRCYLKYIGHPEWKKISFRKFYYRYFRNRPLLGVKVMYNHYKNIDIFKKEEKKYVEFLEKRSNHIL